MSLEEFSKFLSGFGIIAVILILFTIGSASTFILEVIASLFGIIGLSTFGDYLKNSYLNFLN